MIHKCLIENSEDFHTKKRWNSLAVKNGLIQIFPSILGSGEISCNFTFPHGHIRLSSCKGQSEDSMCQYTCDEDYKKHTFMTHVPCWTSLLWSHVIGDKLCTRKYCNCTIRFFKSVSFLLCLFNATF